VLALPLALLAPRRPARGLALLGTAALIVAVTAPLTGHATEHPWGRELGIGLHALHLLGAGLWLGTLFTMLVAALWTAGDGDAEAVARLVNSFSPVALTGATIAVVAGSLLALAYVGHLDALWGSTYGRTLLVKLTLLLATLALGAWNWRVLRPRLGTPEAAHALTRSAGVELLIALCILAATAVLVALPAPAL
ncbi:MAG TPA: CopD family protein, partial [Gemmatimonadales bacterium]|nr:CopD family protein [Gemmatimonadales bacterium]